MTELNPNLLAFAVLLLAVVLKLLATSLVQAIARLKSQRFRHQDDVVFFGKGRGEASTTLSPLDETSNRVWQNDIENIYPYMFAALTFSFAMPNLALQVVYFSLFFLFRCLHTFFLYVPKQPWRNIFYQGGTVMTLLTLGHAIWLLSS